MAPMPSQRDKIPLIRKFKSKMISGFYRKRSLETITLLKKHAEEISSYGFYMGGFADDGLHVVICAHCEMQIPISVLDSDFDPRAIEEIHTQYRLEICPFLFDKDASGDEPYSDTIKDLGFESPDYEKKFPLSAFKDMTCDEPNPKLRCIACHVKKVNIVFSPCRCSYLCADCVALMTGCVHFPTKCGNCDGEVKAYSLVFLS
jgi:hypothetical protein